jgi:hypothetical protein
MNGHIAEKDAHRRDPYASLDAHVISMKGLFCEDGCGLIAPSGRGDSLDAAQELAEDEPWTRADAIRDTSDQYADHADAVLSELYAGRDSWPDDDRPTRAELARDEWGYE